MELYLIVAAIICILCILASNLSYRIGVPSLLLFILLGMMFGTDGIFRINFSDYALSETICSIALVFIMFYGGFCTNWHEARPVAAKSIILSSAGVILTAVITGLFCYYVLKTSLLEGFLIGSILSSTDAASVFSILRVKKLNLVNGMASVLEVESGSNDPVSYMLTIIVLGIMSGKASAASIGIIFSKEVLFGLLFGAVTGCAGYFIFRIDHFRSREMLPILGMSMALLTYGLSNSIGGNGFLSVYIAGIIIGNSKIHYKAEMVHFFDGITGVMQIVLFFLLGLLCFPSRIIPVLLPAAGIWTFMLFIARPIVVALILTPFKVPFREQLLVSWAGLRGAVSIVFAILAVLSPNALELDIFHIVFCVCLLSVSIQGSLLPWMAKKLNVIGPTDDIFRTFNDYSADPAVHLTEIRLPKGHPWIDHTLKDIIIPDGMMAVMILRDGKTVIPRGDTMILADDTIILNSTAYTDSSMKLREVQIGPYHPWVNQKISDLTLPKDTLIFLIQRSGNSLIPDGQTCVKDGDRLILNA
ncbi:potassium/proton antiporter [Lacrimispora sp.]|uniref:potassium/proton antiporter n=1 Tax=Lacrimispora sp. TaxID=2719234 RepID=UPI0039943AEE